MRRNGRTSVNGGASSSMPISNFGADIEKVATVYFNEVDGLNGNTSRILRKHCSANAGFSIDMKVAMKRNTKHAFTSNIQPCNINFVFVMSMIHRVCKNVANESLNHITGKLNQFFELCKNSLPYVP